jgi:20S proteasome alpha/beta subunit
MTTIGIATTNKQCVMMSESGITDENFVTSMPMNKIIRQGEFLIAAAGADRVCDVLQYLVKYPAVPPQLKKKEDYMSWYQWIAKRIIPLIRKVAQEQLTLDVKDGVAELPDSELLLVTHGKAFSISNTLGISRCTPYWAIGSGGSLALGSLATAFRTNKDWETNHSQYLYQAIESAVTHDSFSHPPIYGWVSNTNGTIKEWDSKDLVSTAAHSLKKETAAKHTKANTLPNLTKDANQTEHTIQAITEEDQNK